MKKPNNIQNQDFKKSSFCNFDHMACAEVALKDGVVAIRNSKDTSKVTVVFDHDEWRAFIAGVKNGEFEI